MITFEQLHGVQREYQDWQGNDRMPVPSDKFWHLLDDLLTSAAANPQEVEEHQLRPIKELIDIRTKSGQKIGDDGLPNSGPGRVPNTLMVRYLEELFTAEPYRAKQARNIGEYFSIGRNGDTSQVISMEQILRIYAGNPAGKHRDCCYPDITMAIIQKAFQKWNKEGAVDWPSPDFVMPAERIRRKGFLLLRKELESVSRIYLHWVEASRHEVEQYNVDLSGIMGDERPQHVIEEEEKALEAIDQLSLEGLDDVAAMMQVVTIHRAYPSLKPGEIGCMFNPEVPHQTISKYIKRFEEAFPETELEEVSQE